MHVFLDNVDLSSNSGPNNFANKLKNSLERLGTVCHTDNNRYADVQLSFISATCKVAPLALRLDGIWFNSEQPWELQNKPIYASYRAADSVVFQSQFNKKLTEVFFGKCGNSHIIHNGTDLELINRVPKLEHKYINEHFKTIWSCASHWRPHKRLKGNIDYFLENSSEDECLIVAGNISQQDFFKHERIFFVGSLDWYKLISLFKASEYFIHLAFLDHCPNVVVDARAAGCKIICSDSGGTHEIAGVNSTIIKDLDWDFKPIKLYQPPKLDFDIKKSNKLDTDIDIDTVANKYLKVFQGLVG